MYVVPSSAYLENFISSNPLEIFRQPGEEKYPETPTLAMFEFYRLMAKTGDLFLQETYYNHLLSIWEEYHSSLPKKHQQHLRRRIYGNFYRSGVDQLWVQAILIESRLFDLVGYDQRLDADGVDVIAVTKMGRRLELGCQVDTKKANRLHKKRPGLIVIKKKVSGPKIGNMYFYKRKDLQPILDMGMLDMLIGQNLPMFKQYGQAYDHVAPALPGNCTNSILTA